MTQALCDCVSAWVICTGCSGPFGDAARGLDACLARCEGSATADRRTGQPRTGSRRDPLVRTHPQSLRLNSTPLDVADVFRLQMQRHPAAWIFTSATLAVGDSFEHFQRQLGLDDALTCKWDSPFDYPNQALWYVPRGMPATQRPRLHRAVVIWCCRSSRRGARPRLSAVHQSSAHCARPPDLLHEHLTFPLLVQGNAPKAELLERFVEHGNAVLLGTASFWEGVDVRGEALSVVIIDKLPFASPGDPVLQARLDAVRRHGGNPFMQHQVPQAAIALKQGAGRLIRDVTDRGVLVLCDLRLLKKGYGRFFSTPCHRSPVRASSSRCWRFSVDCAAGRTNAEITCSFNDRESRCILLPMLVLIVCWRRQAQSGSDVVSTKDPATGPDELENTKATGWVSNCCRCRQFHRASYSAAIFPPRCRRAVATRCVFGTIVRNISDGPLQYRVQDWRYGRGRCREADQDQERGGSRNGTAWVCASAGRSLADDSVFAVGDWIQGLRRCRSHTAAWSTCVWCGRSEESVMKNGCRICNVRQRPAWLTGAFCC